MALALLGAQTQPCPSTPHPMLDIGSPDIPSATAPVKYRGVGGGARRMATA